MHDMLDDRLAHLLHSNPRVAERMPAIEEAVRDGRLLPTIAVDEIMGLINEPA
jgi:LAO/AO transport system kinase